MSPGKTSCSVADCDRVSIARRLCRTHYNIEWDRQRSMAEPTWSIRERGASRHCSLKNCEEPYLASGLCKNHYQVAARARRRSAAGLPPVRRVSRTGTCSVEGCDRMVRSRGLCSTHYARPDAPPVARAFTTATPRDCGNCGRSFTPVAFGGGLHATACSWRCRNLISKHLRRVQEAAAEREHVRPVDVYRRDRWTCQLCSIPLANDVWPHPMSPTIDHIVPVSRGGGHTMANVQAAHFRCNTAKGARGGGEQLKLIG